MLGLLTSSMVSLLSRPVSIATGLLVAPVMWYGIKAVCFYTAQKNLVRRIRKSFNGPKAHWLYGNMHEHPGPNEEGLQYYVDLTAKYVTSFVLMLHPLGPLLNIVHPSTAKAIMKTTEPKPVQDGGSYNILKPWLGDGLLLSSGDKWFRNRRLLTPAFHFDVLKQYLEIYNEATDIFMNKLNRLPKGEHIDVFSPVSLLTLNIILRCAFSHEEDIQNIGSQHPYVQAVQNMTKIVEERSFNPLMIFDSIFFRTQTGRQFLDLAAFAHKVSEDVIKKRQQALRENPLAPIKEHPDFLDILLLAKDEDGKGLSDAEIRNEVDTFLFGGHDTTASAISWTLYALAGHPEIQEKAQEEVDQLFQGQEDDQMQWDDLSDLPYLTQCIKESLRLHTPVPVISRKCMNDVPVEGRIIPAGTELDIVVYAVHHNVHVWGKDHMEYKPERFAPEKILQMDSHSFLPFSAGPRNCIGQNFAMHEIKTTIARVLHRFRLSVDPSRPARHVLSAVMRAEDGVYVAFTSRGQAH